MTTKTSSQTPSRSTLVFDQGYFNRFYGNQFTRVVEPVHYARIAKFITAYVGLLELPVTRILDVGAGQGLFKRKLSRQFPQARYLGIDVSDYACEKYGWRKASITGFATGQYDLVICHDVLQYLTAREAELAIANLAKVCRGALYFLALTKEDWAENCDQALTDGAVHLRSAKWYAQRLNRDFRNAGGGLFIARRAGVVSYALHAAR